MGVHTSMEHPVATYASNTTRPQTPAAGAGSILRDARNTQFDNDQLCVRQVQTLRTPMRSRFSALDSMGDSTTQVGICRIGSRRSSVDFRHQFGLQPHRKETFKLSTDPQLVAKTRGIAWRRLTTRRLTAILRYHRPQSPRCLP